MFLVIKREDAVEGEESKCTREGYKRQKRHRERQKREGEQKRNRQGGLMHHSHPNGKSDTIKNYQETITAETYLEPS